MAKKYANKYARAKALVKEMEENIENVRYHANVIVESFVYYINNDANGASTWVKNVLKQGKNILTNYFTRVLEKNDNKDEEESEERLIKDGGNDD